VTAPRIRYLIPALLLLPLGACVTSVNPIYTDDTLLEEPALVGTWAGSSGDVLKILPGEDGSYAAAMIDQDGRASAWIARITRIGRLRWVDAEPEPIPAAWSDDYRGAFLPLHQIWILHRADSLLLLGSLNADSLEALLARDPASGGSLKLGSEAGNLVLTGSTAELRELLAFVADRPGFIEEGDEPMRRVR